MDTVLTYFFAVLAALANAVSSVLQRKADREEPASDNLSLRLIGDLLHNPVWFLGVLGVIAGFLLQAAALSTGPLAVVQPVLIIELPITLMLAGRIFGQPMRRQEWVATAATTLGLAGLLAFLAPSDRPAADVTWWAWTIGLSTNLAVVLGLIALARRRRAAHRAVLLGVATGASFGLAAALLKAVTTAAARHGIPGVLTTWQTYAMVVVGAGAMFLLQSALNAGSLIAAQPGLTSADPVVAVAWGIVVFGESHRTGGWLALAGLSAVLAGLGIYVLSRSPLLGASGRGAATAKREDAPAGVDG